jgi:hypothetical protein
MNGLTRLSLAATITAAFLLNTVAAHADPKATPRPTASPFVLKEKNAPFGLEKEKIEAMQKKNSKGIQQPTVDKTSSKTSAVAASPKLQPINVDLEVARVKKQMHEIQALPLAREQKIQRQRALLDREIVHAKEQMHEVQASDSKESMDAARDRKKAGMDALQKFLDIIRSMNPQI